MTDSPSSKTQPIIIKKYANRRLYDTSSSSYVTLDNVANMIKSGTDLIVYDAKTGEDITRAVLTQIIVEKEAKGQNLLPVSFLRQLISFYGDSMQQWLLPSYLESSMRSFERNQVQMRRYLQETFGDIFPFDSFEKMNNQNMALIEKSLSLFTPLVTIDKVREVNSVDSVPDLSTLQKEIELLKCQIAELKYRKEGVSDEP